MSGWMPPFTIRHPLPLRALVIALGLVLGAVCSHGSSPWNYPVLRNHLEAEGEEVDAFDVRMKWREAVPDTPDWFVTGFLVKDTDTGNLRDYYFDDKDDSNLGEENRAALGIKEKDWSFPAVTGSLDWTSQTKAEVSPKSPPPAQIAEVPLAALDPVDEATLRAEDKTGASSPAQGVRRIGVRRGLGEPVIVCGAEVSDGVWDTLSDGTRVWALRVQSPGAIGMRLFFPVLDLPEGASVWVYNAANPDETQGPYHTIPEGDDGLWTETIFGEETLVELRLPAYADRGAVALEIGSAAHQYVDPVADETLKSAGDCNLDVSCYAAWQNEADAVAGIGTIGGSAMLWCSGSLVSGGREGENLFLTAYHGVDENNAPNTEFYWFYQTEACEGPAPPLSEVPRTGGGADFLVGHPDMAFGDVTLLKLRNEPPPGVRRLGWSSAKQPLGEEVTTIHHPSGSYKRISFGALEEMEEDTFRKSNKYHRVVWSEGTTEPGSSGAPLLTMDSSFLIGQLQGGTASCSQPNAPDYYGQFRTSYPILEPWLQPNGDTDIAEDVNGDGVVDATDLQLVINAVLGIPLPPGISKDDADVNGDGVVDALDIQKVVNAILFGPNKTGPS